MEVQHNWPEAAGMLLLYTNGLAEQRDQPLSQGLTSLLAAAQAAADEAVGLEETVDAVLAAMVLAPRPMTWRSSLCGCSEELRTAGGPGLRSAHVRCRSSARRARSTGAVHPVVDASRAQGGTVRRRGRGVAQRSPRAPAVATPRMMGWTSGSFYIAGGVAAVLSTVPVWAHLAASTLAMFVLAAVASVLGGCLLRWGGRLPRWSFHVVVGQATLLLATGVLLSADDVAAMAVAGIFVFCAVDNLYFFSWRGALAHTGLLLSAIVASLVARGIPWGVVAAVVVVQLLIVAVVGRLAQRASDSTRDHLTGLPNRRGFDEQLEAAVRNAQRSDTPLSVALIDIDRFKDVNDRRGHAAGDVLLHTLSATLKATLPDPARSADAATGEDAAPARGAYLARLGGDEFAVVLPGAGVPAARQLAERLRAAALPVGLSVGVAQRGVGEDASSLVRRADSALYEAKAAGRGRVRAARAEDGQLLRDLAAAIAGDQLHVALQPVVDATTAAMVGVEALARWQHPTRGAVSPAVFIPLAEAHGLMVDLGEVLARRAVRGARALTQRRREVLLLTLNASGKQLVHPEYVPSLLMLLQEEVWPTAQLVVEVTESVVEASSQRARDALQELREAGVRVAIDDFGTGYSALSQLDALPADYLKLDARFSADLLTSSRRRAVLRGLLRMCEDLDLAVIAEGVETAAQAELISGLGVPLAQGYYFHRPASVTDLTGYGVIPVVPPSPGALPSQQSPAPTPVTAEPSGLRGPS